MRDAAAWIVMRRHRGPKQHPARLACIGGLLIQPALLATAFAQQGIGPVQCHVRATDEFGLAASAAKELCVGAFDDTPARCIDQVVDRIDFVTPNAVAICRGALTTDPADCAARLEDTTDLDDSQIASSCAAQRWPFFEPPGSGSPACVEAALDRTDVSDFEAVRLCRGATSTDPVACYELGDDETALSGPDLVDLCATVATLIPCTAALHATGCTLDPAR